MRRLVQGRAAQARRPLGRRRGQLVLIRRWRSGFAGGDDLGPLTRESAVSGEVPSAAPPPTVDPGPVACPTSAGPRRRGGSAGKGVALWRRFPPVPACFLLIALMLTPGRRAQAGEGEDWHLSWRRDAAVAGLGIAFFIASRSLEERLSPVGRVISDRSAVPAFDRWLMRRYSTAWDRTSDLALAAALSLPCLWELLDDGDGRELGRTFLVQLEIASWVGGLTSLSKWATGRARPYAYSRDTPADLLQQSDSRASFFSGHTSQAFASAELLRQRVRRRGAPWVASYSGYAVAVFTGLARVAAGTHFASDVAAGALVGVLGAKAIIALHRCGAEVHAVRIPGGWAVVLSVSR